MDWRSVVAMLVLIFVGIPLMVKLVVFLTHVTGVDLASTTQEGSELIAEAATPWWFNLVNKLLEFGTPGAIVVVAFLWVLKEADVL